MFIFHCCFHFLKTFSTDRLYRIEIKQGICSTYRMCSWPCLRLHHWSVTLKKIVTQGRLFIDKPTKSANIRLSTNLMMTVKSVVQLGQNSQEQIKLKKLVQGILNLKLKIRTRAQINQTQLGRYTIKARAHFLSHFWHDSFKQNLHRQDPLIENQGWNLQKTTFEESRIEP